MGLATIQRIDALTPIEGKDRIELASVLGWKVIVRKGEFEVGSPGVFFEVGSRLPDRPEFDFMRSRKFKVKSLRMGGVLSQGLCLPLSPFPGIPEEVGTDVTEWLGVQDIHHNPEDHVKEKFHRDFPSVWGIPKTDEVNVQSHPGMIQELLGQPYYITTKLDGQSCTMALLPDGEFVVCSRKRIVDPSDGDSRWWEINHRYGVEGKLREFAASSTPYHLAIQGEMCGPGIQKNRLGLMEVDWFVFDIFVIEEGRFMDMSDLRHYCGELGLKMVPLEENHASFPYYKMDSLLERSQSTYANGRNAEGIVVRPVFPTVSEANKGGRLSFKVMNPDF